MSSPREQPTGGTGSATGYEQGSEPTVGYQQPGAQGAPQGYQQPAGRHAAAGGTAAEPSEGKRMAVAGFTGLAGALMILGGLWSVVVGIVALSNRHFVFTSANYTFAYTIHNWGWFDLILGCVVFAAGVCLFLGMAWARFLGVGLAIISAVGNFMFIPHQPLWSIVVIAVDALIIWALLSPRHSGELA